MHSWSVLPEDLTKFGAKADRHGRYLIYGMAQVVIIGDLFADILHRVGQLKSTLVPARRWEGR